MKRDHNIWHFQPAQTNIPRPVEEYSHSRLTTTSASNRSKFTCTVLALLLPRAHSHTRVANHSRPAFNRIRSLL